ncbi:MAG: hypothetical protein CL696_06390 [Chloroflexi bacterium]|nr:hypothetical protein [Chloroflexota bacterium]MQG55836.1 hypothetical protein [SAR202 cluster bacterium]
MLVIFGYRWGPHNTCSVLVIHAALLLEQGVNPKVVSEHLGHASVATTMDIYSHVSPEMRGKTALAIDAALAPNR